jgi:hypothetical protein
LVAHAAKRLKVLAKAAYVSWKIRKRYATFRAPNSVRHGVMAKQTSSRAQQICVLSERSVSINACIYGEVTERLKVHDWKICGGSVLSFSLFI